MGNGGANKGDIAEILSTYFGALTQDAGPKKVGIMWRMGRGSPREAPYTVLYILVY